MRYDFLPTGVAPVRFTVDDAERAFEEWGANCGPGAAAGEGAGRE